MISYVFSKRLDDEVDRLRNELIQAGGEVSYVRFPRFYRLLRWDVSDRERDVRRGEILIRLGHVVLGLILLQAAIYDISDGSVWRAPGWDFAVGAIFTLGILLMYWEPYRQCEIVLLSFALTMQMIFYTIAGLAGLLGIFLGNSTWGAASAFPVCIVFLWCWRACRIYERDLLRGKH